MTSGGDGGEGAFVFVLFALLAHGRFGNGRTGDRPKDITWNSAVPVGVVDMNIGGRIRRGQRGLPTVNSRSRSRSFVW